MRFPKSPPTRDVPYRKWVSGLPCHVCGSPPPNQVSHHPKPGHGSMGMKTSDYHTIPLCYRCHGAHHAGTLGVSHEVLHEAAVALRSRHVGGGDEF